MRAMMVAFLAFLLLVTAPTTAWRQSDDLLTERLTTLGRVWVTVKFAHPRVALSDRDWDAVLDTALPAVKAAADDKAFAQAVGAMLATIRDPATRVVSGDDATHRPRAAPTPVPPAIAPLPSGALLIDVRAPGALADTAVMRKALTEHMGTIAKADRLVVDVRGAGMAGAGGGQILGMLNDVLVGAMTPMPATRFVRHSGYRPQAGGASFYSSEMATSVAAAQAPRAGIGPRRVAFVLDEESLVPPIALALQASGHGAIVVVGTPPPPQENTHREPLGSGAFALVRVADMVIGGRRVELHADVTAAATDADARIHAAAADAIASAREPRRGIEDPEPTWRPEAAYSDQAYPTEARRLLAVYRLWGVFDYFFPYKHLMDVPWNDALTAFIPKALAARTDLEYAQVMAQMAALTADSHVNVTGIPSFTKFMGEVMPPVMVRYIERRPIVTRVVDPSAAPGLQVGDEVVSVDGEEAAARAARIERYLSYSTAAGRDRVVGQRLLAGDRGSVGKAMVRGADGKLREVSVTRTPPAVAPTNRAGEVTRILDGNIGYADLERLQVSDVAEMFKRFKNTIGIIFDMRGYPRETGWVIAPRINTRHSAGAALFQRPIVSAGATHERITFTQPLPATTEWIYDKPTVMLIDERAISQSEHTGLFFKAANNTTFVGSPTTGANGDVTSTVLPGGLRVSFTGHDVRWPDGRQLQRVGLVPDVPVAPTIAGIRAGRDEVLERAVSVIMGKRKS